MAVTATPPKKKKTASVTGTSTYRVEGSSTTTTTATGGTTITYKPSGSGSQGSNPVIVDTSQGPVDLKPSTYQVEAEKVAQAGGYSENKQVEVNTSQGAVDLRKQSYKEINAQKIYIDTQAVKDYNQANASQGINNAQDYFTAVRNEQASKRFKQEGAGWRDTQTGAYYSSNATPKNTYKPPIQSNPAGYTAPPFRPEAPQQTNLSESQQPVNTSKEIYPRDYELVDTKPGIDYSRNPLAKPLPWYASREGQIQAIQNQEIKTIAFLEQYRELGANPTLAQAVVSYGASYVTSPIFLTEAALQFIKTPLLDKPGFLGKAVIEGSAEYLGEGVTNIQQGNIVALAGQAGEYKGISKTLSTAGSIIAGTAENIRKVEVRLGAEELKTPWERATGTGGGQPPPPPPPPENPAFREIDTNEIGNPAFKYIPIEYTELGKNIEKVKQEPLDAGAGETLPGTFLEAVQPKEFADIRFYKTYPNIPPELQTRLSIQPPASRGLAELTPAELLERIKENLKRSEQQTLQQATGEAPAKTSYFESQAWQEKLLKMEVEKAKEKLNQESLDIERAAIEKERQDFLDLGKKGQSRINPLETIGELIQEQAPKVSETLKGKYATYKATATIITGEGIRYIRAGEGLKPVVRIATTLDTRQSNIPITSLSLAQSQTARQVQGLTSASALAQRQAQQQAQGLTQSQNLAQLQAQVQVQEQQQTQIQQQAQVQQQVQAQQLIQAQSLSWNNPPKPPKEIITTLKIKPPKTQTSAFGSFNIQIRRQGAFKTIATASNLGQAQRQGENIVQETAAASYRITQDNKPVTLNSRLGFYASKKEPGVYIQPKEQRINTPGEKAEITRLGILSSKYKKNKRGAF